MNIEPLSELLELTNEILSITSNRGGVVADASKYMLLFFIITMVCLSI